MLGKLQELIILANLKVGDGALPGDIVREINAAVPNKPPAFGAVYTTLDRLAKKGLLSETVGRIGKGRDRRAFTVTPEGMKEIRLALRSSFALGAENIVNYN